MVSEFAFFFFHLSSVLEIPIFHALIPDSDKLMDMILTCIFFIEGIKL